MFYFGAIPESTDDLQVSIDEQDNYLLEHSFSESMIRTKVIEIVDIMKKIYMCGRRIK